MAGLSRRLTAAAVFLAGAILQTNAQQTSSPVLDAMKAELTRSQVKLKTQPVPPYYISYEIIETRDVAVAGAFGKLERSSEGRRRNLDTDLRVGDYSLDNTREVRGEMNFPQFGTTVIPIDNDPDAIRAVLWHQTDQRYKRALEQFTKVKTNVKVKVALEDQAADFSKESPQQYSEPVVNLQVNRPLWGDKVRKFTAPFARYTNIYQATASFQASVVTRWYVNTEGSVIQTSEPAYHLFINAISKASDGM